MSKRRVFDIDFEPEADTESVPALVEPAAPDADAARRGPMASAISENARALGERQATEAAIRAENDRLAHEYVALKRDGAIVGRVPLDEIRVTKLIRDRSSGTDPELSELKASIRAVGLSNPIHVEEIEAGRFELVQGFRRLSAFQELLAETGDDSFRKIPAVLIARGTALEQLYRRMVDENLVRKDISFAEMANLAIHYARESGCTTHQAVDDLFGSAGRQKRSYIRHFAELMRRIGRFLKFPEAIPRALGLRLVKAIEADPKLAERIATVLQRQPERTVQDEIDVLQRALAPTKAQRAPTAKAAAKQTMRFNRPQGEARVSATRGKVELRMERDFGAVDPRKLELAVRAFLEQLGL